MTKTAAETAEFAAERRAWFHHELKTAVDHGDALEIEYNAARLTFWVQTETAARQAMTATEQTQ